MRRRPSPWLPAPALAALTALAPVAAAQELPPDDEGALAHLESSPRHGEWVTYDAGDGDEVSAWVVHPERSDAAPVVVVIHEIFGLTDWIRAVADQLAAEGYLAIAPDLLSGKGADGGGTESFDRQGVGRAIRDLDASEVQQRLAAAATWATALPSTTDRVGSVGFCWGGSTSFAFAAWEGLAGAVVYYGSTPDADVLASIEVPVLGLYGGDDNRVNSTIPAAEEGLAGRVRYEPLVLDGAGHGFLRNQAGQEGANLEASGSAWARTLSFFDQVLGGA
jgi:carboxymethylenebutenolidase